jgi:hypothetical protein
LSRPGDRGVGHWRRVGALLFGTVLLFGVAASPAGNLVLDVVAPAGIDTTIDPSTLEVVDAGDKPDPDAPASNPPDPPDQISDTDRARLRTILNSNPTFTTLIGNRSYTVDESGYWDDHTGFSGASADLSLSSPFSRASVTLPSLVFNDCGLGNPTAYTVLNFNMQVSGATGLDVEVDFEKNRVVDISPTPDEVVEYAANTPPSPYDCSGVDYD